MYIKKISGLRMMKNMRYFEPNHILVSVIKSKNICRVSICDETCTVWRGFFILREIKPKFGVKNIKKEPYWCYQLVCRIS